MPPRKTSLRLLLVAALALTPRLAVAQDPPAPAAADKGMTMLTIFLKHDQSRTLGEINARLDQQHYFQAFPPEGVEVVSWYVMMGIGQVVTLRFPSERLREVNRAIEQTAWGPYRTEFYPTYDYKPTAMKERKPAP